MSDPAADLARITEQLQRVQFTSFDERDAWAVGCEIRDRVLARGAAVTVEVRLLGQTVFLHAMAGTSPANADWARRKRNTVDAVHKPSYAVGLAAKRDGRSAIDAMFLDRRDHTDHGGCVPIRVVGTGIVGTVTVSGLPERDDHELVIEVLADRCGVPYTEIALDPA